MSISLKSTLRAAALARRDALSDGQRHDAARAIAARADVFDIKPGTIVAGYIPMRNEIDPRPLMLRLAARGARLALPTVVGRDAPLVFRAWQLDDALVAGPFGTSHPEDHVEEVVPDIVLVPLAAFDRRGIELQEFAEQHGSDVGSAHRQAGMAGFGLFHGIHGERANRVGHLGVFNARRHGFCLQLKGFGDGPRGGEAAVCKDFW